MSLDFIYYGTLWHKDPFFLVGLRTEVCQTLKENKRSSSGPSPCTPTPSISPGIWWNTDNFPFYLGAFGQLSNCGLLGALVICEPQPGRDCLFHQMANMITFFQYSNSSSNIPVIGQERTLYHQVMTNGFQAHNGGTFCWIYLEIA